MVRKWIGTVVATAALSAVVHAGTLQITNPSISNQLLTVPVHVGGDVADGVAALDFLLNYDPSVLEVVGVTPGTAASSAGKMVHGAATNPGQYVVVMMGMNQSAVRSGEVVSVTMRQIGNPANDQSELSITRTTFASLDAVEIPSEGSAATIVLEGADEGEDPDDGDDQTDPADSDGGEGDDAEADGQNETDDEQALVPTGQPKTSEDTDTTESQTRAPLLTGSPIAALGGAGADGTEGRPRALDLRQLAALVKAAENRRAALPTPAVGGAEGGDASDGDPSDPNSERATEGPLTAKPAGPPSADAPHSGNPAAPRAVTAPVSQIRPELSGKSKTATDGPGQGLAGGEATVWAVAGVALMAAVAAGLLTVRRRVFR